MHNGVTPWKTERANWNLYQNIAHVQIPREDFISVQEVVHHFKSRSHLAQNQHFPEAQVTFVNPECSDGQKKRREAVRARKAALRQLKRRPSYRLLCTIRQCEQKRDKLKEVDKLHGSNM